MSKSGFSTLNRWLGRKNKEKSMPNGSLSKSSTNLSISSTNINETSQLEYNRITPLPAATTNAPFEQTFRITVLLPKDQLYVARLGARVPLSKLLELVCDNKLLDSEKYEFRNPVDSSQVYSCDLTIGAVGLSEIRLCHKSESYDNFSTDEIMKLQRTSLIRESLTSSEFSSRNSKHTTKTTSPYSSSNSLNSMDSSGIHSTKAMRLSAGPQAKMAAPPRKKRAAPRPPSQAVIPEKSPLITENGNGGARESPAPSSPVNGNMEAKDFSVSTPDLSSHSDINGNDCNGHMQDIKETSQAEANGYSDDTVLYAQVQKKNALNLNSTSVENLTASSPTPSSLGGESSKFPEPSPRKRVVPAPKKKMVAPPAPQPRGSTYSDDSVSIGSANLSSEPSTPVALTTPVQEFKAPSPQPAQRQQSREDMAAAPDVPKPQPRITTTTLLNATDLKADLKNLESHTAEKREESNNEEKQKVVSNVSKVMLNRTPTPEPRSLSCEPPDIDVCYETQLENLKSPIEDDNVSKQADSGIGEPVPSPIPDSLPSEVSIHDVKSNFESSSDDDDMVKVYNFKLGKTLVKPLNETKTLEELTIMNDVQEETDSDLNTPNLTQVNSSNAPSETSSWNFAIPISPPPNFADNKFSEAFVEAEKQEQENPITPKIMERPILNFEVLKQEDQTKAKSKSVSTPSTVTPSTPLDSIVGELSAIIQEKGLDTLIKKSEESQEIEAAKPNTLTNFTINSVSRATLTKPKEVQNEVVQAKQEVETSPPSPLDSPTNAPDEEKLYRKRNSVTGLKQRRSITRSDSFHTTAIATENTSSSGTLTKRTSSQISLDQMANGNLNRRRSSSELSIGESPSLQSLEVMKTILNARKNSLPHSGEEEEEEVNTRRPSEEIKFASLELKNKMALEKSPNPRQGEEEVEAKKLESKENIKKLWQNRANTEIEEYNKNVAKSFNEKESPKQQTRNETPTTEDNPKAFKKEEETDEITQLRRKEIPVEEKPKELPRVYRYSGPPSINFSTWSERPKVQVAIKNEGDYIFGGKSIENKAIENKTVPRSYRMSTPLNFNEPTTQESKVLPSVAPKPATIKRMGIPEKEFKVPVMVKPIKDVIVESTHEQKTKVTANGEEQNPKTPATPSETAKPMLQVAAKPQSPVLHKPPTPVKVISNGGQRLSLHRPTIESVLKPQTQTIVNTHTHNSTLPRTNKRFSTSLSTTSNTTSITNGAQTSATPITPGPQLLRSTSTKREERETKSMFIPNEAPSAPAPFGQNTLRRTGFKEKIMAKDEEEQQKAISTSSISLAKTPTTNATTPSKALTNGELKFTTAAKFEKKPTNTITATTTTTSAKLHLNLQKSTSITVTNSSSSSIITPPTPSLKPKPHTPKTAPILATASQPPPPPPPAMAYKLKPVTAVRTPTASEDPRDQLLAAIRNFKKDELKRA
ncbi:mucin-2 [Stomoxys calcitrans]|uniref:mucin-2 n=1 Tax=Stomoxys calcitrans TaxID=35570 RepID=UPI0027E3775C|nr:mucin-2 [Stomoxys calcitrans]XP_013105981.2 mucin-2 [Stomoxys calcitrans]XP_013105983.2 mucin-2 [Stomoxys calcitrans]XP_013105984.2 mucin-2 [Stomoxys calcitrans]XP_059222437.1 mucin-2 [Stomoxys calcitrans]XP_059222438.1 mucin-2 [Stomoxys calcitrans]XP_059222439.1 mucin-2 [Stomoxys calcitrans]XP_059222440.1 mucin-2 [Stomoxys calcitrans]XP_059222441.1 mucin-2 [Stomoxys calcitrans]